MKPNFKGYLINPEYNMRIDINSDGFREEEIKAEQRNILVLGDSMTFGVGVENEESFPYVLEKMINDNTKMEYQVINAGVMG